jgi:NAD(P)-dependent dehydrogenase (short-subunit alcohol dehydrogenase family)
MFQQMGRTAVVTGAGRGIGLAFAKQLVADGYMVFGTARTPSKYEAFRELEALGRFRSLPLDVGSADSIAQLALTLEGSIEALDILVNCAGINSMSNAPHSKESSLRLGALEQSSLLNQFKVNAVGPTLVAQALLPLLEAADGARILNVSSWLGSIAKKSSGGNYGYCASKAALNMMNRALAEDLRDRGIISVVMNPGWVRTDMGGQKAKLSPEESVAGMLRTLLAAKLEDSGIFLQWDGTTHPW